MPQHYRIVQRRSSEGISPYFLLLGSTAGSSALANMLLLSSTVTDLRCCRVVSGFECFAGVLGLAQVGVQWLGFSVILLLFLVFFPRATPHVLRRPQQPHSLRLALLVTFIYLVHLVVTFLLAVVLAKARPSAIAGYAIAHGLFASVLTTLQYLPQLYTTYRLRAAASLSIPMMLIQTPGGYLWAVSLGLRVGWAGWSLWLIPVVAATLQGVLLLMALRFEFAARPSRTSGVDGARQTKAGRGAPAAGQPDEVEPDRLDDDGGHEHDATGPAAERNSEREPLLGSATAATKHDAP